MARPLLAAALVLATLAEPGAAESVRTWNLGHGFSARVHATQVGDYRAKRVLLIRRGSRVIRRFSREDEGLGVQVADVTGDRTKDALVLDYWDGSGACGEYTFFASTRFNPAWRWQECADTGIARLFKGALVTWTAVSSSKTKASGSGIHCCWSRWRHSKWQLRRGRMVRVRSTVGPPPPSRWRVQLLPGTFP